MRWLPLAVIILAQIAYPLVPGDRAVLVVLIVATGFAASVGHAVATRGTRVGVALVAVTAGGGLAVEAVGLATGFPFGAYVYGDALGPGLLGVPAVIPLAWTWMAWPAWLAAAHIARRTPTRVLVAGAALAAWDLFLDPQMVREGYWRWTAPDPLTLPGVPDVPMWNHVGWLGVGVIMMTLFAATAGPAAAVADRQADAPMLALYVWTFASSVLAHAFFLDLPASALWGALGMGAVAVPLVVRVRR